MILAAIVIVLLAAFLLWYAGGPWEEPWRIERDDYEAPMWRWRR